MVYLLPAEYNEKNLMYYLLFSDLFDPPQHTFPNIFPIIPHYATFSLTLSVNIYKLSPWDYLCSIFSPLSISSLQPALNVHSALGDGWARRTSPYLRQRFSEAHSLDRYEWNIWNTLRWIISFKYGTDMGAGSWGGCSCLIGVGEGGKVIGKAAESRV